MILFTVIVYLVCIVGGLLAYRSLCRAVDQLPELKGTQLRAR